MDPSIFIKKYQSHFNSPTFSDVTVILPSKKTGRPKKRKTPDSEPEDERERIFAHKVILGLGSSVLGQYIKEGSEIEIASVCEVDSTECYMLMLRYLYGLPLDDEFEYIEIETTKGLYDAAIEFEIPELCQYVLRKLEERLMRFLDDLLFSPEEGPPLNTNRSLDPFIDHLEKLLEADEQDYDRENSAMIKMVVRICSKYFAVVRQWWEFKALGLRYPKLILDITYYAAAKGGDLLRTDPRTVRQVSTPLYHDADD